MPNDERPIQEIAVEASTFGLAPGVWPDTLEYQGKTWTKDHETSADNGKGEVQYVEYQSDETSQWLVLYRD